MNYTNTLTVHFVIYWAPFLKWTTEELSQLDQRRESQLQCTRPYIEKTTQTDNMFQEKKKEEVSPVVKIAWMHEYEEPKTAVKEQKKNLYSDQKQHRQHNDRQNSNNKEKEMRRKTTLWIFQETSKRNLTRGDLDIPKKVKTQERN